MHLFDLNLNISIPPYVTVTLPTLRYVTLRYVTLRYVTLDIKAAHCSEMFNPITAFVGQPPHHFMLLMFIRKSHLREDGLKGGQSYLLLTICSPMYAIMFNRKSHLREDGSKRR
jgi:hypothetical protein